MNILSASLPASLKIADIWAGQCSYPLPSNQGRLLLRGLASAKTRRDTLLWRDQQQLVED
jgi:hypothetical protein